VKSGTQAEANLIFTEAQVDCLGLTKYAGLVIKGSPESDGHQTCRAQGTVDLDALKDFGIKLSQTGEYLMLDLAMPEQFGYMPTSVDITFPGAVLDGGGSTVSGNTVQLTELSGAASPGSARLVALSHAGPEWWVMALAAGFGGGPHRGGPAPRAPAPAPPGDPAGARGAASPRCDRPRQRDGVNPQPHNHPQHRPPGTRPRRRLRGAVRPARTGHGHRSATPTGRAPAAP